MVPSGEEEPEPSKKTVEPLTDEVKMAVGAWSGAAMQQLELFPTVMAVPAVFEIRFIGTKRLLLQQATYALVPSGVIAMSLG